MRGVVLAAAVVVARAAVASAQGLPCPEFQANEYTTGYQRFAQVASAPNGDFVVVWESYDQNHGVFGRRFDASGTPFGPEFPVSAPTGGFDPAVAVDAGGNFVVVWNGVFGQRFDASGTPLGPRFTISSPGGGWASVSARASGEFVVVWTGDDGGGLGVFGRRFDAAGAPLGPEFRINTYTTNEQWRPVVSVQPSGEFVVVWSSQFQDGSATGVFGQRFDASGAPSGSEFQVNTYTTLGQDYPRVAHGPNGDFVVVWWSPDGSMDGVFARRFNSGGTPQGPEVLVNTYTTGEQYRPAIAGDPNAGYTVVWNSVGEDGSAQGVFGRRLGTTGVPLGPAFRVNGYTTSSQWLSSVAPGLNGGFVTVWESWGGQDGSGSGIFGGFECVTRFHAVTPCRVADTRNPPGTPLAAGSSRDFPVRGTCGIPADAAAVALNVTAVNPTDGGDLRLYPAGTPLPLASVLNFGAGRTRASNAVAHLPANGQVAVRCDMPPGSAGTTHVVLDVYGYFKR